MSAVEITMIVAHVRGDVDNDEEVAAAVMFELDRIAQFCGASGMSWEISRGGAQVQLGVIDDRGTCWVGVVETRDA